MQNQEHETLNIVNESVLLKVNAMVKVTTDMSGR